MTIFDTEDWLEPAETGVAEANRLRSKEDAVGEITPWENTDGENVADLDCPPPLLPPPPPPWDAVVDAAAEDAAVVAGKGVVARERGDSS